MGLIHNLIQILVHANENAEIIGISSDGVRYYVSKMNQERMAKTSQKML